MKKMTIKYNRSSSVSQSGNRFKIDKRKYDKTIHETISGRVPFEKRSGGHELMSLIREGVVEKVVFADLSRCGRNLADTRAILDEIVEVHDVRVEILGQNLHSHDENGNISGVWKITSSILLSIHEMNRDILLQLCSEGRKAYVEAGGKLGRPENSFESESDFIKKKQSRSVLRLLNQGKSQRDIQARLKCSPKTITKVRRVAKKMNLLKIAS